VLTHWSIALTESASIISMVTSMTFTYLTSPHGYNWQNMYNLTFDYPPCRPQLGQLSSTYCSWVLNWFTNVTSDFTMQFTLLSSYVASAGIRISEDRFKGLPVVHGQALNRLVAYLCSWQFLLGRFHTSMNYNEAKGWILCSILHTSLTLAAYDEQCT
jgi:hypothetical protein